MNKRLLAFRLALLVALAGLVPIAVVGAVGIAALERRSLGAAQESLHAVASQAAGRLGGYLDQQRQLLRAIAAVGGAPGAEGRLADVPLDAPSLAELTVFAAPAPAAAVKHFQPALIAQAMGGKEAASEVYLSADTTPVIDLCAPISGPPRRALCARTDLLELWRFVQRLKVGAAGYALAFDDRGRLIASGLGSLRPAILTGERIVESDLAQAALRDPATVPTRYLRSDGEAVLAGWAPLRHQGWVIVVEQPAAEALAATRAAQWGLGAALLLTLLVSLAVGLTQSQRVLGALAIEERWRTAGRIAAGITHDLGHRLRVLQQTAGLAEARDPAFLEQIHQNLRAEVATLQKFVADFSDLSRDVRTPELFPLELGDFLESVRRTASPHAQAAGVILEVLPPPAPVWTRADRHLLERAALNLISNAIEASPKGATVRLSAVQGERAVIEVGDLGAGISAERQQQLFDAFVSTKKTGAHLGMGLANVKRIAEALGGAVSVESRQGQGSTFRIALPNGPAPEVASTAR